ncbi:MAG: 50S ribosomal protein L16 [Spirochaetales bacterium]|jgi:large subunit ribosomal protein L16|nr:50S ribosomal protein L16 [Spirochaetales bacterium]MBQ3698108.1 50S ribosomal protein L16 [Spirochaetales bacterium]MBQ3727908.1 50S ribosomal protein L16 [Spirochaetales bacterium]MBQ3829989.1 50S ribosomal protein L16 [Spirochaetales bacterium]MBQ6123975.1 50S ribosomal protein L16 [Spirochaetales bacterium]
MLSPKRIKYRKKQRGTRDGVAHRGNQVSFGDYGLVALEPRWITNRQIEAARVAMTRHAKRGARVWIRIYPDMPYTSKPIGTRQGNGKGAPEGWVAVVKQGAVMFEMADVDEQIAREALTLAASKLPIKTKFVSKREVEE